MTDERRRDFLDALDASDEIAPTDWECRFIESTMDMVEFSPRQREVVDAMAEKYGGMLSW